MTPSSTEGLPGTQQSAPQGMWGRYALFVVLSFGLLLLNLYLMKIFNPRDEGQPGDGEEVAVGADTGEERASAEGEEAEPPEGEPEPGERQPPQPGAEAEEPQAEAPRPAAEEPPPPEEPELPLEGATLGSLDPASPYRMLVTLTNRGAAVARIELNSPRFHDLEDRSGYLGHVVLDPTLRGSGCLVQVVGPGTPAALAGLQQGDLIKKVDDQRVTGFDSLEDALKNTKPEQFVKLAVVRRGTPMVLPVTLRRRPLEVVRPEGNDPLSFLLTLRQIDDLYLEDLKKDDDPKAGDPKEDDEKDDDKKGDKKRDESLGLELDGLKLRTGHWEVVSRSLDEVVFRRLLPKWGLEVTKTYRLAKVPAESTGDPNHKNYKAYHLVFDVKIRNTGNKVREVAYQLDGPTGLPIEGAWYARKIGRGWGAAGLRDVTLAWEGEAPKLVSCVKIADDNWGTVWKDDHPMSFIGVDAQYFSAVMIPQKKPGEKWFAESQPLRVGPVDAKWKSTTNTSCRVSTPAHKLKPGGTLSHSYEIFAGPKRPDLLAEYAEGGLKELIVYGWFWWVAIPMLWILHIFYAVVGNYGLAIIMLTILVRSCMFPLSRKMALNAQKMQKLQPEIKKLQEKHKKNLEARTKAQQELFKKHNYNPLAGCLPMFLQLPIFLGLYRGLMVDVELRQAPLLSEAIRWCSNLAAPDMLFEWRWLMPLFVTDDRAGGLLGMLFLGPYFNLLPILTVILFIAQQKMFMPPPADEQAATQQKVMQFMMVVIGLMFFKVASGLCLYFVVSSLWGIAERKLLPKSSPSGSDDKSKQRKSPRFKWPQLNWLLPPAQEAKAQKPKAQEAKAQEAELQARLREEKGQQRKAEEDKPREAKAKQGQSQPPVVPGGDGAAPRKKKRKKRSRRR